MCGIFGYLGTRDAGQVVFRGLADLEYRGYDSWGIVVRLGSKLRVYKDTGFLPQAINLPTGASLALGHTRWATHGGVTKHNAHPHLSCGERLAVVHNGIFENYHEVKSALSRAHQFRSETDTEVIAHYLEEKLDEGQELVQAVQSLVKLMTGLNALVVCDAPTGAMVAYRRGSPLVLGRSPGQLYVSSDLPTLSPSVKQVYALRDGELILLTGNLDDLAWVRSPRSVTRAAPLTRRYHMESEIEECLALLSGGHHFNQPNLVKLKRIITRSSDLVLTGCGSAYHACLYGAWLLARQGISARVVIASEGSAILPTIKAGTVVVAVSQSGETIDTVQFGQACLARGAVLTCLTNVPYSTLDRLASTHLYLNVGVEVAVASTKAYVFMLLAFAALAKQRSASLTPALSRLLSPSSRASIRSQARSLLKLDHLFVLGQGQFYPLALETALKFKEIGYLHAEAIASGELKHGPLALITPGVVCLNFTAQNSTCAEIQARGGEIMTLALPELGTLTSVYGTVYIHLLSYYFSLLCHHNPDRPRNLAKSVTVK